jgi:hypothetical protein
MLAVNAAEGEADVERGPHERLRLHPLLAREDVDRVGAEGPPPFRAEPVGELPEGHGEDELEDAGHRDAEADLTGAETDDLGEEDGAAGQQRALADREDHRLDREAARQRRRREESLEAPRHGPIRSCGASVVTWI